MRMLSVALLLAPCMALAAGAHFDPDFGTGGVVEVPWSGGSTAANAIGIDGNGRVSAVKVRPTSGGSLTNVLTSITYRPFGPAATYSFASGGQALTLGYDRNDRLTDVTGTVLNFHFCRDAEANFTRLRTATPACSGTPLEQYDYDAPYRLEQVQDGAGSLIEGYSYNLTGDRLAKTQGGTTANYVYDAGSHHLAKVDNELRDHDANGNLVHGSADGRSFKFD